MRRERDGSLRGLGAPDLSRAFEARRIGGGLARGIGARGLGGGALASWTPSLLTNLRADWDPRFVQNTAGETVTAEDKSGNGNDLTAAAAGNRFPYVASGYNGGSLPYWAPTTAGNDWMRKAAFSWGGAVSAFTIVIIGRIVTQGVATCWAAYGGSNRPAWLLGPGAAYQTFQCLAVSASSFTTTQNNLHRMWWFRWNGTTQSVGTNLTQEDSDADAGAAPADGGTFAVNATSSGAAIADSQIARVLVMRSAITADELAALYSYAQRMGYGV